MPESGGCERHATDPFVSHLNAMFGSRYAHRACLDRLHRNSAQPEALYTDPDTGADLVLERKSVVWPLDYAARHKNDHIIAETLFEELSDFAKDRPTTIHLAASPRVSQREATEIGSEIAASVKAHADGVAQGFIATSRGKGLHWSALADWEDRRESGESETGLIVRWYQSDAFLSPDRLPDELVNHLKRLFEGTAKKFRGYPDARKVLLLDPYGTVRYSDSKWWTRALQPIPLPKEVTEIWLGLYDWISEFNQGWIFERIHVPVKLI